MVVSGDLDSRARVIESELAARLGISRTPVREALQRLEGDGLILAQGRGVRVRVMAIDELAELFTARAGLEGWALFEAARRIGAGEVPPATLAELEHLADAADALSRAGDIERAADSNRTFHERTAALANNRAISETLRQWWDRTTVSTRHTIRSPRRVEEVDQEHRRILNALNSGQPSAARDAVQAHILTTRDTLINLNGGNRL